MRKVAALPQQQLLHITHARQDTAWVQGVLIPALGLSEGQFWTRAEDDLGRLKLQEIERAVESCRYTLLVASSAARIDEWAQFAGVLAQHLGTEEGKPRLLIATRDFAPDSERGRELLPLRQRCLECLDCSDPERSASSLAKLAAQLALTVVAEVPAECPYPGLRMFGAGEQGSCFDRPDLFFGRDDESRQLVEQLLTDHRVLLLGPSGCGKSSLVRARVLPALRQGADAMEIAVVRPGRDANSALSIALEPFVSQLAAADCEGARAISSGDTAKPWLLVYVDQFEEVFLDRGDNPVGRAAFFAHLGTLCRNPGVALLIGMRADFYADLMRSAIWDDFKDHRVELAPLRGAGLRAAIIGPAERAGVFVEVDLVERLVRESEQDRAAEALPLLQVALVQLWEQRYWRHLSLASYDRLSEGSRHGLDAVLSQHADGVIASLSGQLQPLARRVLIDLVHLGEGRPNTRRRRTVSELVRVGDDVHGLAGVIEHLAGRRLIVVGSELLQGVEQRNVDLAHDALITGWPALAGWLYDRRDHLKTQRRFEARAAGGLLPASELPEFRRWVMWTDTPEGREFGASEALRKLVRRSVAARKRFISGLVALIVILAVVAGVAYWQRGEARDNHAQATRERDRADDKARLALSKQLAMQAADLSTKQLDLALLLAVHAGLAHEDPDARKSVYDTVLLTPFLSRFLHGHSGPAHAISFSPDGRYLVSAGADESIHVWDIGRGEQIANMVGHTAEVVSLAFTPDGVSLLSGGRDGTVRLWRVADWSPDGAPLRTHAEGHSVRFAVHPNGHGLAVTGDDGKLHIWDLAQRKDAGVIDISCQQRVRFSPDGQLIGCLGYSTITVLNVSEDTLRRFEVPIPPSERTAVSAAAKAEVDALRERMAPIIASSEEARRSALLLGVLDPTPRSDVLELWDFHFTPDNEQIVAVGRHGKVSLFEIDDGEHRETSMGGSQCIAVGPADKLPLLATCTTTEIVLWNVGDLPSNDRLRIPFEGSMPVDIALSPDGHTMAAIYSSDSRIAVWELRDHPAVGQPLTGHGDDIWHLCASNDKVVVTGAKDGTIAFWDPDKRALRGEPLKAHDSHIWSMTCARDTPRVVTTDGVNVTIWDASTGKAESEQLPQIVFGVNQLSLNPNGTLLAEALEGTELAAWMKPRPAGYPQMAVWDLTTRMPIKLPPPIPPARVVQFSPDGKLLAAASRQIVLLDVATWKPVGPPIDVDRMTIEQIAFTPDGKMLICFGWSGQVNDAQLFDVATGRRIGGAWQGFDGTPLSIHFDASGSVMIASTDMEQTWFWDMSTRTPLGAPIPGRQSLLLRGGRTLVIAAQRSIQLRDSPITEAEKRACARANRNLTSAEWAQFIGNGWPYCRACDASLVGGAPVDAPLCRRE